MGALRVFAFVFPLVAADLPITGIARIGFAVSDLEDARSFYTGVLGFEEAFRIPKPGGGIETAHFKVNDTQYIELSPGLPPDQDERLTHIAFETSHIEVVRRVLSEAIADVPHATRLGPDGNRYLSLRDPNGLRVDFVQYLPGSWQSEAQGKFLSDRRLGTRILHLGVRIVDLERALRFYRDILGGREFWRGGPNPGELRIINVAMPGRHGDYIELMLYPDPPSRKHLGGIHHVCFETPDIYASYREAIERGAPPMRSWPHIGRNGRLLLNLFDPDGSRTELMERRRARRARSANH